MAAGEQSSNLKYPRIPWWQRLIQQLSAIEVISTWFLSKYLHHIDAAVLKWSQGRKNLTTMLAGLPVVLITTVGAKSGRPRTLPLAGFPDGERIILVPTNFGQENYPGWYYNLLANPIVHMQQNGSLKEYTARTADQGEWQEYWDLAVYYYPGYQAYRERRGNREVPLFILEPKS